MITINFHGGDSRNKSATSREAFLFLAALCGFFLIGGYGYVTIKAEIREARETRDALSSRVVDLRQKMGEVSDLERLRSELRRQLLMVAILKRKKRGPIHLLDDLNTALPERAWLTEITEKGGALQIRGKALDNQTVSDFMRRLSESNFLKDIDLNESKQETLNGVKLQSFSLKARALFGGKELPEMLSK